MTKRAAKTATVKKTKSSPSCPILQRIMSYSPEEKKETKLLKNMKRRMKREAVKLKKAEDQKRVEEEKNSSSTGGVDAAELTTITKKKQRPPQPKRPVQVLPYLHEKHNFDRDKVPPNLKESFWYTGKV